MTKIVCSNSPLRPSSEPRRSGPLKRAVLACVLTLGMPVGAALAQAEDQVPRTPILVIDYEELFRVSDFGQTIQQELDESRRQLSEEIAVIDAELAAEERELTERRAELSPEDFRALADAFDEKVQRLRGQQDEKARALTRLQADEQLRFRQAALPIVGQLMLDSGALIVVEKRALVVFNDGIDVTALAARRLDATAEGAAEETPDPSPEEDAEPAPAPATED